MGQKLAAWMSKILQTSSRRRVRILTNAGLFSKEVSEILKRDEETQI